MNWFSTKEKGGIPLEEARSVLHQMDMEIQKAAMVDPDRRGDLTMYSRMGLPETEITRRITDQYALEHYIAVPTNSSYLEENRITVAPSGEVAFAPVDHCIGILATSRSGYDCGVHITADDGEDHVTSALKYYEQIVKLLPESDISHITLISQHLGESAQHRAVIALIQSHLPSEIIDLRKQSYI